MNRLNGIIESIEYGSQFALVRVTFEKEPIHVLVVDTELPSFIQVQQKVVLAFNESDTFIATEQIAITVSNHLRGVVTNIIENTFLSRITLKMPNGVSLNALIPCIQLSSVNITKGESAVIYVNATSIMIEKDVICSA